MVINMADKASKRQANLELLRIVLILMIIAVHYMVKGDPASYSNNGWTPLYAVVRILTAFGVPSLNCYVFISGYFMVDAEWKPGRVVSLLVQVLFYSILVPLVLLGLGIIPWGSLNLYDWLGFFLPIETEHYWFATAYLYLYLFSPILVAGVKHMEKRTLQIVIIVLLLFFSVGKSVVPVYLVTDKGGYDYGWLLCLFLVAAYLRLYGLEWLEKKGRGLGFYIVMSFGAFLLSTLSEFLSAKIGKFSYYVDIPYTLNHVCILLASLGLFMVFKNLRIQEGTAAKVIRKLAPYTFGVYLLHEHILVRYRWIDWLQTDKVRGTWLFLPHMAGCVLVVYLAGVLIDSVRTYAFSKIRRLQWKR